MAKKPARKSLRIPTQRELIEQKVFEGALAIIAKHKALDAAKAEEEAKAKTAKKERTHAPTDAFNAKLNASFKTSMPQASSASSKLARGNTVQYQGKAYMFFRLNKQKQAILIAQDGEERVTVDPTQLT